MKGKDRISLLGVAVVIYIASLGADAQAKTLFIANNGLDSPTCGAVNAPCRSISQAIANASPGDKVIVGPGRYRDPAEIRVKVGLIP